MASFSHLNYLITCARGFESQLIEEAISLGAGEAEDKGGGVWVRGDFALGMRLCLWSRLANRVLVSVAEMYVHDMSCFYDLGGKVPLEPWFSPDSTFCIRTHVNDERFRNPVILSLKVKDGLVDQMRERWGRRASVDTHEPDVVLSLQVVQKRARLFVELQGDALNMRGYRGRQVQAPIRETLAAGMLRMSGWSGEGRFLDPMCGSGTFGIEAALMASGTAPGIQRRFGFERLPFFDDFRSVWQGFRESAREDARRGRKQFAGEIVSSDMDVAALDVAQNNAQTAGVDGMIRFVRADVLSIQPQTGTLVMNPPYGERMEVNGLALPEFYYQLGRHLRVFPDSKLTIISTSQLLKKNMHMRPSQRISTYNGPIPCEVATYALGKGTSHGKEEV